MDFENQVPDAIVEDAGNAQEGEISDDAAETVAGGKTKYADGAIPRFATSVNANGASGRTRDR